MRPQFARPVPQFSIITTAMMNIICSNIVTAWEALIKLGFPLQIFKPMLMLSMRPELPTQTVVDLWTGRSDQFLDLELYRGLYTMDVKTFMLLIFNWWLPLMDWLLPCYGAIEGRCQDSNTLADSLSLLSRNSFMHLWWPRISLPAQLQTPFRDSSSSSIHPWALLDQVLNGFLGT